MGVPTRVPIESTPPASDTPPLSGPRPIPSTAARTDAADARWHAQVVKRCERGERTRQTPRQLSVFEKAANPKRSRPPCAAQENPCVLGVAIRGPTRASVQSTTRPSPRPCFGAPTCPLDYASPRLAQSRPIRRARPRANAVGMRRHAQPAKICERGERAWHTPCQRVVFEIAANQKKCTRPFHAVLQHKPRNCSRPVNAISPLPSTGRNSNLTLLVQLRYLGVPTPCPSRAKYPHRPCPTRALDCASPRLAQSQPIGRARPRAEAVGARRNAQISKPRERGERARHTPRQQVVA
jgi:hypothetical protein